MLNEGQGKVEAACQQGLIDRQVGGNVDVSGTVVAVDAIHVVAGGLGNLIFAEGGVFGEVLGDAALHIFDVNVGNDLAFLVGGHIVDLVADVHVPVDAFGGAGGGISTAGLDAHA